MRKMGSGRAPGHLVTFRERSLAGRPPAPAIFFALLLIVDKVGMSHLPCPVEYGTERDTTDGREKGCAFGCEESELSRGRVNACGYLTSFSFLGLPSFHHFISYQLRSRETLFLQRFSSFAESRFSQSRLIYEENSS